MRPQSFHQLRSYPSTTGGPTETMPPLPGSPAIAAGAIEDDANGNPITTDQRGLPLPTDSAPDIGAVQTLPAPTCHKSKCLLNIA
jgi:hypothetical protein